MGQSILVKGTKRLRLSPQAGLNLTAGSSSSDTPNFLARTTLQRAPFLLCRRVLLDKKAPTLSIYLSFNKNHHPPPSACAVCH